MCSVLNLVFISVLKRMHNKIFYSGKFGAVQIEKHTLIQQPPYSIDVFPN